MVRPYFDYKNKVLGSKIDYDGSYGYQCVDLFKDYCSKVLGKSFSKTGNANEIWGNKYSIFGEDWIKIPGTNDLMQGDIIISIKGTYGHIAIFDRYVDGKIYVLEQNGSGQNSGNGIGDNAIRVHGYYSDFWIGVRRSKKIWENWKKEMAFIKNKVKTKGLDKETKEYAESTLHRI